MKYLVVRHRVEDYRRWKKIFDDTRPTEADGFGFGRILCDLDEPNVITVIYEVLDIHKARHFLESRDTAEAMKSAGVSGQPEIYWLDELLQVPATSHAYVR